MGHHKTFLKSPFSPIYSHIQLFLHPSHPTSPQRVLSSMRERWASHSLHPFPHSFILTIDMINLKYIFKFPTSNNFSIPKHSLYGNSGPGYFPQTSGLYLCFPVCMTKLKKILLERQELQWQWEEKMSLCPHLQEGHSLEKETSPTGTDSIKIDW